MILWKKTYILKEKYVLWEMFRKYFDFFYEYPCKNVTDLSYYKYSFVSELSEHLLFWDINLNFLAAGGGVFNGRVR